MRCFQSKNPNTITEKQIALGEIPPDSLVSSLSTYLSPLPSLDTIPTPLRSSLTSLLAPTQTALQGSFLPPILSQSIDILFQVPSLIHEVASGARDFIPTPSNVKTAARRAYRARRTLLIKYDDDPIDETDDIEMYLKESENAMRVKRPMVRIDLKKVVLGGGHATPCLAPSLEIAEKAEEILGEGAAKDNLGYKGVDETVDELVKWLEESFTPENVG